MLLIVKRGVDKNWLKIPGFSREQPLISFFIAVTGSGFRSQHTMLQPNATPVLV